MTTSLRRTYLILVVATIAAGLALQLSGIGAGTAVRDILGDALWAAMIFWLVSLVAPRTGRAPRAAVAMAICVAVELSQRIDHPVLQAARSTLPGHLVLGSDFDARDLAAYAAGVVAALLIDKMEFTRNRV